MEIEEILKKHVGADGTFNQDAAEKELKAEQAKAFVPKDVFNAKNDELKDLSNQVTDLDQQLEASVGVDVVKLQKQIETLTNQGKEQDEQFEQRLNQVKYDTLLDQELIKAGARNPKSLKAMLELDEIQLAEDAEGFTGLEEQLNNLKSTSGYMFGDTSGNDEDAPAYAKYLTAAQQQEGFNMTNFLKEQKGE